jgi:hypothetical protein
MMAARGFDTLAFVKRLSAAGMESRHAEALAEALNDNAFEALATKADIRELRSELTGLELRLTIRLGGMIAATLALTVAILGSLVVH